ncbi:OB-fold protein [Flavisolibacter tropicus]|uniref:tRNA_anti-like n=1 Tax=Flavisolibacter tropicus TaxID=1492898 RepID=A0A172TSU9_9BACT|nr:hypothetical protein [Flavisolibacter tropicus]ANE49843.1 hypothetical protein SY85_04390 [Flavisolibacter tropicus]
MSKKTIFLIVIIVCLIVAGWAYYLYQKPRAGVKGVDADYTIAAGSLYQAFVANEDSANKIYVDKVIQVEGKVQQVETTQEGANVILASNVPDGGINCTFSTKNELPKVGDQVVIKGRCTGFLMDVSLVDAEIEKN